VDSFIDLDEFALLLLLLLFAAGLILIGSWGWLGLLPDLLDESSE
jgi:hypothetical protein